MIMFTVTAQVDRTGNKQASGAEGGFAIPSGLGTFHEPHVLDSIKDTPRRIPHHHINQRFHSVALRPSYLVRPHVYVALPIDYYKNCACAGPWAIRDPETWIESKVLSLVLLATCTLTLYTKTLSVFGTADAFWGACQDLVV